MSDKSIGSGIEPLVTVALVCFNHADNLARCLDSVLGQKTDFPIKTVVLDDCSTDGSQDIIRDYAARDHRVEGVFHEQNLFSQGRRTFAEYQERITSPFFTVFDSDDYWCDDTKLQRQIDALRAHPDAIACAHAVEYRTVEGELITTRGQRGHAPEKMFDIYSTRFCHNSTTVYRNFLADIPAADRVFLCRDVMRFYYALTKGRLVYLDRAMSVTRRTGTGVWSSLDDSRRAAELQELYFKLDRYLGFRYTRKFRHLYLPHEGKNLFSLSIPCFWRGRRLRFSVSKA